MESVPDNKNENNIDSRSISEIESDLEKVEIEMSNLSEELEVYADIFSDSNPSDLQRADQVLGQLFYSEETPPSEVDVVEQVPDIVKPYVSRIYAQAMRFRAMLNEKKALENEYVPYLQEEFTEKLRAVSSIDYESMVHYCTEAYKTADGFPGFKNSLEAMSSVVMDIRRNQYQITHNSEILDYDFLKSALVELEAIESEFSEKGFLREPFPSNAPLFEPTDNAALDSLRQVVSEMMELLERSARHDSIYRLPSFRGDYYYRELREINRILDVSQSSSSSSSVFLSHRLDEQTQVADEDVGFDPKFLIVLQKYVADRIQEHMNAGRIPRTPESLTALQEEIDTINFFEKILAIKFNQFTVSEGEVLAVSPEVIIRNIARYIPTSFISSLQTITYSSEKISRGNDPDIVIGGTCRPSLKDGNFEGFDIVVYRDIAVQESEDNEREKLFVEKDFLRILWHEIAHVVHRVRLDYDDISAWERVIEEDQTPITWYVQDSRPGPDSPNGSEAKGKREDFAETFRFYVSDPYVLESLSPARYQYMEKLFSKYSPTFIRDHLAANNKITYESHARAFSEMGFDDQKIREHYLIHVKTKHD